MKPDRVPSPSSTVTLGGLTFDALTESEVIDQIVVSIGRGDGGWLVNPNVDVLRTVNRRPELQRLVAGADLVIADGMPLVWAARLAGTPLPERVAGATLIVTLTARAAADHIAVFLLGGQEGAAERAAMKLRTATPQLRIGWHCPPFGFEGDRAAREDIFRALDVHGPSICYCAFGFPKQEWLMAELHDRYPNSWFIGSGASVDFLAGAQSRAPLWMQRVGAEWLHRLSREPRRLFRRYVIEDIPFAVVLLVRSARIRRWRR